MIVSSQTGSAASDVLPDGISMLDPQEMVFAAMIEGWSRQMNSRQLKQQTISPRLSVVRSLVAATGNGI